MTLFQFAEGLADRAAADAVRCRLDWKYTLGLAIDDPGIDVTVLLEFRHRLLVHAAARLLFETLLDKLKAVGLVKARGKQRTDSTRVLASVHSYNRLDCVWETCGMPSTALRKLRRIGCVSTHCWLWYERYARKPAGYRLNEKERLALKEQIGSDGYQLLAAVWKKSTAPDLRQLPALQVLRHI